MNKIKPKKIDKEKKVEPSFYKVSCKKNLKIECCFNFHEDTKEEENLKRFLLFLIRDAMKY
jgi:hypothetical protein